MRTTPLAIARHCIYVLESIDAIDLAFDTLACGLLDGEVDTSATRLQRDRGWSRSHWDEAPGHAGSCRRRVGWPCVRGDTTAPPDASWRPLPEHPGQPVRPGVVPLDRPVPASAVAAGVRTLRFRVRSRSAFYCRSAACGCCAAERIREQETRCDLRLRVRILRPSIRGAAGINEAGPRQCPECGGRSHGVRAAHDSLQGSGWARRTAGDERSCAPRRQRRAVVAESFGQWSAEQASAQLRDVGRGNHGRPQPDLHFGAARRGRLSAR